MKQIATLVMAIVIFAFSVFQTALAQPVNTHRSFTWDAWPANSLSQPNFLNNFGPDNVNLAVSMVFSGTPSGYSAKTYTYANQGGRTSDLKIEKLPGSEDTLTVTLTFNKNLEGLNMDFNPYNSSYVWVKAYNQVGTQVHVKGLYDFSMTDSVPRIGDSVLKYSNKDLHVYFTAPVSKIVYKVVRNSGATNGMEFALGPVSWYNSSDYTANPDLAYKCDSNKILLILDASSSIDATERSNLITAIEAMLDDLKYYATTPNEVAFVEFSQKARLGLDFTQVSPASISSGGAIYDYLHNTNGNGYYSTNSLYGGYTDWPQAFKEALAEARKDKPNLLIFFTDGAPNRIYEPNDGSSSNLLMSASWGVNRTALYADTLKQMGIHLLGVGVDRINSTTRDFYFRYPLEMVNPEIYDYSVPPPSNISTADYVTVAVFPDLELVFRNLYLSCASSLPTHFKSVLVQPNGCISNTISWAMENESDALRYNVQVSSDGTHFGTIGTIDLEDGKNANYSFVDKNPAGGALYYRIEAVLQSGESLYSQTTVLQSACTVASKLLLWPNPVRSSDLSLQFTDSYTGTVTMQIFDMQGRRVRLESLQKNQSLLQVKTNIQALGAGFYTVGIFDGSHRLLAQHKFIKQ